MQASFTAIQGKKRKNRMAIGLIIIGDEILSGKRTDKHLPKMIELLHARGLQLGWAEITGGRITVRATAVLVAVPRLLLTRTE